ncbi:hypothetical protein EcCFBP13530_01940 [Enterobacter cancerogenus]|uniref:Uncharacterized protein n=1 Tax=Enterobacter cancerogenus TaxID=69218 RepID=A0AB38P9E2_9ENTR|nr:hypothetical protein EcCFBP13530_01940 [Enterobacter cancerogenus]
MTVWLGCEQRGRIIGNYWLLIDFVPLNSGQKKDPAGSFLVQGIIYTQIDERLPHALTDRSSI